MKAGLITFHSAHHYGAQLQAYALMKAIMNTGAHCEIIDYVRIDTIEGNKLFKKGLNPRSLLSNVHTILNYPSLKRRFNRFEEFRDTEMELSEKFYTSGSNILLDNPPRYDVYVCGSDQIWNPFIYKEKTFDPVFFADFAEGGRRIAYAPSFGISKMPEDKCELLKEYLSGFEALSVREKQGEEIIREVTGRDSITVLDPTLLLTGEEWSEKASEPEMDRPYILCYFISDPSKYSQYVKALADKYKLPVISLCGARRVVQGTTKIVLDAGPREFLGLFKNASLVCTNSFHGTVFSVNFKKDFFCFSEKMDTQRAVNSRIFNILDRLDLKARIVTPETEVSIDTDSKLDYDKVYGKLSVERTTSMNYLKKALWKVTDDNINQPLCR